MAAKKRDEEILAGLGYKQEFKRAFTPLEVFGIAGAKRMNPGENPQSLPVGSLKYLLDNLNRNEAIFPKLRLLSLENEPVTPNVQDSLVHFLQRHWARSGNMLSLRLVNCIALDRDAISCLSRVAEVQWDGKGLVEDDDSKLGEDGDEMFYSDFW